LPTPTPGVAPRRLWWQLVLPFVLMFGTTPIFAQPAPPQLPAPPEATHEAESGKLQARIDAAALALRKSNPRLKNLPPEYVQRLAEFVSGNMLFVLLHEMAHVAITQMGFGAGQDGRCGRFVCRPEADQGGVRFYASHSH
jgi:hypothetical protein